MSVLIQGMEMPKSCFMCPFSEINDADTDLCSITGELYDSTPFKPEFRRSDCPLIEIPPHGRLIDADRFDVFAYDSDAAKKYGDTFDGGVEYVLDVIAQSDTIIPADKED